MSTPDDVLGWLTSPLERMRRDYEADPATPWEERRESFLRELGVSDASQYPVVQELLERLDETRADERGKMLGSDELDRLAQELARQHAAGQADGQQAAGQQTGYDERAWQAFLAENGPRWDGTDASWDQFRQWFVYTAGQQGLGAPATALLDYLAARPAAERITTFAQYGVTIPAPQAAAAQSPEPVMTEEQSMEALPDLLDGLGAG